MSSPHLQAEIAEAREIRIRQGAKEIYVTLKMLVEAMQSIPSDGSKCPEPIIQYVTRRLEHAARVIDFIESGELD
jgi:hypothetical protein